MSSRTGLLAAISVLLALLLAARCIGRPPWPGSGDRSKDRTDQVEFR